MAQRVFQTPETKFRVIAPDVGGGFGMKGDAYPEDALVLWASRRCGRPVKWVATRSESLLGDAHGRDQVIHGEMALDEQGQILAIRARARQAFGAYVTGAAVAPLLFSVQLVPERVRRAGGLPRDAGDLHAYVADGPVPRRGSPGGGLSHRAAARPRRGGHRHRSH